MIVTTRNVSPFGAVKRSKYSLTVVLALYGTPFFRRYPGRRFVVSTLSWPCPGSTPAGGRGSTDGPGASLRRRASSPAVEIGFCRSTRRRSSPAIRCHVWRRRAGEPQQAGLRARVGVDAQGVVILPMDVQSPRNPHDRRGAVQDLHSSPAASPRPDPPASAALEDLEVERKCRVRSSRGDPAQSSVDASLP